MADRISPCGPQSHWLAVSFRIVQVKAAAPKRYSRIWENFALDRRINVVATYPVGSKSFSFSKWSSHRVIARGIIFFFSSILSCRCAMATACTFLAWPVVLGGVGRLDIKSPTAPNPSLFLLLLNPCPSHFSSQVASRSEFFSTVHSLCV